MEQPELTFAALDAYIEQLPMHPSYSTATPRGAKWGFAMGALGAALSLFCIKVLPPNQLYTAVLAGLFLVVEIAGVVIAGISQLPKTWPTFSSSRREFADELDFDLPHHRNLVQWLQGFPRDRLEKLSEFVAYRHERMQEKLPMLTGNIEKLGALPVFIALYIQFKDMHWPPHPSWAEISLMLALVFIYWLSVLQISVRLRLQSYDVLLKKALA